MADQTLRFTLDMTNIEEADDGNTTHFGGTYVLDGVEKRGHGDDRSDSHRDDILEYILAKCEANWPELSSEGAFDPSDDVKAGVSDEADNLELEAAAGTIVVTRQDNGIFVVTRE